MKLVPLAALTLALPFVLSGCSSSPSLETQTKLIEYEQCLENARQRLYWAYEADQLVPLKSYTASEQSEFSVEDFQAFVSACSKYRP